MGNNWLVDIFLRILEMSITAGIIICMVLGVRLCLRKAPKIFSYLLWSVVLFRLLCPVAAESRFSVLGLWRAPAVATELDSGKSPWLISYQSALPSVGGAVGSPDDNGEESIKAASQSVWNQSSILAEKPGADIFLQENRKQMPGRTDAQNEGGMDVRQQVHFQWAVLWVGGVIWIIGIVCMAGYGFLSTLCLKKRLANSMCVKDNIYISDRIDTPFAMGIITPKIYLPGFLSEKEMDYIILHEKTHIGRGDLPVKLLAFAALSVHWFNPLVWIAFLAAEKDMEMSCDETVMKQMKADIRAEYSKSLLCLATGKTMIGGTPLAFGEGNTKSRIKNIMQYKKPAVFVVGLAAVLVTGCLVGFGTNPNGNKESVPADTKQENAASDFGKKDESAYERVYSVQLNTDKDEIPFEIWIKSDSDKMIKIDGQEIAIAPEFAAKVKYEQVETTLYYDFTGDGKEEIALIDTGGASGGAIQTIQIFENTDGQWNEMELPSDIYSVLPVFVEEKLKELELYAENVDLTYHRTVSLSYEDEKIRMNYKLFTDDLSVAVGTVHKEVVYSPAQKKFVLEDLTWFTPALSGESAYNAYENAYSAELETGKEKTLFEIWCGAVSDNKVIRIDGQEIPIVPEAASGRYGGIVETKVYDYTGDGKEEIVLVDCGNDNSFLVFGNRDGKWEEIAVPAEIYNDSDSEFWKKGLEEWNIKIDDTVYPRSRTVSFNDEKILIAYHIFADSDAGPVEVGTVQKEIFYSLDKKEFVWGDASFIPYS